MKEPHISEILAEHADQVRKKYEITKEKILDELYRIAFFDIREVMRPGASGVALKTWEEMEEDVTRAIQSVTETDGEKSSSRSIKAHDKIAALTLLGKHAGLWAKDGGEEETAPITLNYNLDDEK